ncbi:MAG TPA: tetratricopeptide repeat protein [bacterium (Candidatus Stahlbacteria)]|nr:tetratricopeptide repeat protein [Candidatus Stahlbacteria bacterium]
MVFLVIVTLSADSLYLSYLNFRRGYRHEQAGELRTAIMYYEKAKVYAPGSYEIDYYIASARYSLGDYALAKKVLSQVIKKEKNFENYRLLGDCEMKLDNISRAVQAYKRALEYRSDDLLIYRLASVLEAMGKLREALAYYQMVKDSDPELKVELRIASILGRLGYPSKVIEYLKSYQLTGDSEYYLNLAVSYDRLGMKDSALISYLRVLVLDSTNLQVLKRVFDIYIQMDSLERAEDYGQRALRLAPFDLGLNRSFGYLAYKEGDHDQALSHFIIAVGIDDQDLYSNYYLGRVFFEKKMFERAEYYLNKVLRVEPTFGEAIFYLGLINLEKGDYRLARHYFYHAIRNGFEKSEGYCLIGLGHAMEGDLEKAYQNLHYALKLDPDNLRILGSLANVCDDLRFYDEAMEHFTRIIEIDSSNAVALNYVGYTYAERGDSLDYALELIKRALEIEPNNGYFIDSLGWVYFQMGDYDRALKELLRAKGIIEDGVILEHLGDTYLKLKRYDEAREAYQRAYELDPEKKGLKEKLRSIRPCE